jgi:hypothetical protein
MAMAIWPDARLKKFMSSCENGASVVRKIDRIPSARPRFTSGILQKAFMPSAATNSDASDASSLGSHVLMTTGFKVSSAFLTAALGVTSNSSLTTPFHAENPWPIP